MRSWLLGVQSVFMRGIGVRKLRQALDIKSDIIHDDLASRIDALNGQVSQQGRADTERGDTIQNMLIELRAAGGELAGNVSLQGRADTDRGDTIQNMLIELRAAVGELAVNVSLQGRADTDRGDTIQNMLIELRAAVSELTHQLVHQNGSGLAKGNRDTSHDASFRAGIARDTQLEAFASSPLPLAMIKIIERLETNIIQAGHQQSQQLRDFFMSLSLQTAASEAMLGKMASHGAETARAIAAIDMTVRSMSKNRSTLQPHLLVGSAAEPEGANVKGDH